MDTKSTCKEGQWISLDGLENATLLLRREVDLGDVPTSALITVTAMGYFELYINGNRVGNSLLDPPVSNYSKRVFPITHTITDYLQTGPNCIALWLGRGWYRGYDLGPQGVMRPVGVGALPGVISEGPVVRCSLNLGERDVYSDTQWRAMPGPIVETADWRWDRFGGEVYDARRETPGWKTPGFDDSQWQQAIPIDVPELISESPQIPPNRKLKTYTIDSFEEIEPGVYEGDVGTCLTGWLEVEFGPLATGQEVAITYSDNNKHRRFNRYNQEDRYIARGKGKERFSNCFNYHGFRWFRVEGAKPIKAKAHLVAMDLPLLTRFSCSNERLNSIHAMVQHTLRCLTFNGVQMDCPHRERLGYGGDGTASLFAMLTHFDCRDFYRHWLTLWRDELQPDGGLPHTAPAPYRAGGGPVWCGFPLTAAWFHYLYYGDIAILREQYSAIKSWFDYVAIYTEDGLLKGWPDTEYRNWYLGDWLPPKPIDPRHEESVPLVCNCFLVECYDRASSVAKALGYEDDEKIYRGMANDLRLRLHEVSYHDGSYGSGSQIDLAYPLLTSVVPDGLRQQVLETLIGVIEESGKPKFGTGLVGNGVLFELLDAEGRGDLLTAMVDSDEAPGWGYMLAQGATTTWEDWEGKESRIHNCFNQVNGWFIRGMIGLTPTADAPGFRRFHVRPQPAPAVDWAEAECQTPAGTIAVRWEQNEDFRLELTVPEGSEAQVLLPDGSQHTLTPGEHTLRCQR